MEGVNLLAVQIGYVYQKAQSDEKKMDRISKVIESYFPEIDHNKSIYEHVKEMGSDKAQELLNAITA